MAIMKLIDQVAAKQNPLKDYYQKQDQKKLHEQNNNSRGTIFHFMHYESLTILSVH